MFGGRGTGAGEGVLGIVLRSSGIICAIKARILEAPLLKPQYGVLRQFSKNTLAGVIVRMPSPRTRTRTHTHTHTWDFLEQ